MHLGVCGPRGRFVVSVLALALAVPLAAIAKSFTPLTSRLSARSLHGFEDSAALNIAGCSVGRAAAFFGVDARSDAATQYLTSGLQWRYSDKRLRLIRFSALQTAARGASVAGRTLVRTTGQIGGGSRWYTPQVTFEAARINERTGAANRAPGGRAFRLGVDQQFGGADTRLSLFRAEAGYNAPGDALPVAGRGVTLTSGYETPRVRLSGQLVAQRTARAAVRERFGQRLRIVGPVAMSPGAALWQLEARSGTEQAAFRPGERALAAELGLTQLGLGEWRLDSRLGWFENALYGGRNLPLSGAMGRVAAKRTIYFKGVPATLSPSFTLGDSARASAGLAARGRLSLAVRRAAQNYGVSLSYVSAGFNRPDLGSDLRLMVHFTRRGVPRLAGL